MSDCRYNDAGRMAVMRGDRHISAYMQRLLGRRVVRYALVGGVGIPVNDAALFIFSHLGVNFYPLAFVLAFEVSTTVNFVLNQTFTYGEQKHLKGWDWPRRALRAQVASLTAFGFASGIALLLFYGLHVNRYVANPIGIVGAFLLNFKIANRFVFRPAPPPLPPRARPAPRESIL